MKREARQSTKVRIKVQSQIILVSGPTINQMVGEKHVKVQINVQLQIIDKIFAGEKVKYIVKVRSHMKYQGLGVSQTRSRVMLNLWPFYATYMSQKAHHKKYIFISSYSKIVLLASKMRCWRI